MKIDDYGFNLVKSSDFSVQYTEWRDAVRHSVNEEGNSKKLPSWYIRLGTNKVGIFKVSMTTAKYVYVYVWFYSSIKDSDSFMDYLPPCIDHNKQKIGRLLMADFKD